MVLFTEVPSGSLHTENYIIELGNLLVVWIEEWSHAH